LTRVGLGLSNDFSWGEVTAVDGVEVELELGLDLRLWVDIRLWLRFKKDLVVVDGSR